MDYREHIARAVAYIEQNLTGDIDLAACAIEDRARICQVLQRSAAFDDPRCGEGDRRYFRVEVVYQPTDGSDSRTVDFRIAEEDAPEALRQLWEEDRG